MRNPTVCVCYVLFWDTYISIKIYKNDESASQVLSKLIFGYCNLLFISKNIKTQKLSA